MALTFIDPRYIEWDTWVRQLLVTSTNLPAPRPESQWRDWATQALITQPNAPDPRGFDSWRAWALAWLRSS